MTFSQIELLEAEIKILDDVFKKNSLSLCNGIGKPCEQETYSNPSKTHPNRTSTRLINKYSCDNCIQSKRAMILDTARKRNPLVARLNVLKKAQKIRDEENKNILPIDKQELEKFRLEEINEPEIENFVSLDVKDSMNTIHTIDTIDTVDTTPTNNTIPLGLGGLAITGVIAYFLLRGK